MADGGAEVVGEVGLVEVAEVAGEQGQVDLGLLARDLGYFDQAHFAHDFRAAVGDPPVVYARTALG